VPDTLTAATAAPPGATPPRRPDWRLIGLFYGLAFGWVALVALGISLTGARMGLTQVPVYAQLVVGLFYMPAPLVAALITERVAGRRLLIRDLFRGLRVGRFFALCIAGAAGLYAADLLLTLLLGNVLHVSGVGELASSQAQFVENMTQLFGVERMKAATVPLPSVWAFYLLGLVAGPIVGFTINGLFGLGEEYGWRGFLMDELRPLGAVRANLLTGVMWGFWHAPLIWMGFNYAAHTLVGPLFMIALCIPFSFLFWSAREYAGSVLAAAALHGAFNGMAGVLTLLTIGRSPLLGVPTGLVGALGIAVVALPVWRLAKRAARPELARTRASQERGG
jgi:membrane protease YdiL (CAAX protease family)